MKKLTLASAISAIGIGAFVEKEIKFRASNGEEVIGNVLIKVLSHDEVVNVTDVWGAKNKGELTIDQYRKALLFHSVYETEEDKFFPAIKDTGLVSSELIDALYNAADEVVNFSGKNWISSQTTNSGVNSSSTELAEEH
ncbi:hypothetical protein [Acinetobacter bereziniae]|uniref:hypothetical protein n=1 Tax=Acinetobacter bereziniae TaxID=106648 RepID=UPI00073E9FB3|nr:hypothetical protein [Acinetobacter bereziniae]RSZ23644.1 hypothetical protein NDM229_021245 [Acinetobacter bereziniae]